MKNKKATTIIKHLKNIILKYTSRDLNITDIFGDGEFNVDDIITSTLPVTLHICSADEHVPKVERAIRTVKERTRTICHNLPYDSFPKMMTICLIKNVTRWLNAFPSSVGVSEQYSPASIIDGSPNPDYNRKRLPFGAYAMVYFGTSNTMTQRAVPAIALNESTLDGTYFLTLDTGKKIHSKKWEVLPINDNVIEQVNAFANKQKQPQMPMRVPIFEWAPGLMIDIPDIPDEDDIVHANNDAIEPVDPPNPANFDNYHNIISDNDDSNSDDESDAETIPNEPSVNHHNPADQLLNGDDPAHLSDDETCVSDNDSVHSDEFSFNIDNAYNDDDGEPTSEILPDSSDETPNCESTTINNSVPSNEDENQSIYQDGDVSDTVTTV